MFAMIKLKTNALKYKNSDGSMVGIDVIGGKQVVDSELSTESTNPIQNKVVSEAVERLSDEIAELRESGGSDSSSSSGGGMVVRVEAINESTGTADKNAFEIADALKSGVNVVCHTLVPFNLEDRIFVSSPVEFSDFVYEDGYRETSIYFRYYADGTFCNINIFRMGDSEGVDIF